MWHTLDWGAEDGYSLNNFGGAGKPDEEYGVRDFKAKFGSGNPSGFPHGHSIACSEHPGLVSRLV